jgi:hypothetical protein
MPRVGLVMGGLTVFVRRSRVVVPAVFLVLGVVLLGVFSAVAFAAPEEPTSGSANPIGSTTATLNGVLNPNATGPVEPGVYEFLYAQSASECEGLLAPEPAGVAAGLEKEAVSASLTGLLPGMPYTFCLQERNIAEEASTGSPVTFTTLAVAPTVIGTSASEVAATGALLVAEIDPGGSETTYHFEYGATSAYGQSTPESVSVGADDSNHSATFYVTDLQPATTYHYRVVASSSQSPGGVFGADETLTTPTASGQLPGAGKSEDCPNEQLRAEQPYGLGLPDCRAYEMVSPLEKNDNDAVVEGESRAAFSGERVVYNSLGVYATAESGHLEDSYLSRRTADGWSTLNITPRILPTNLFGSGAVPSFYGEGFSEDLSKGLLARQNLPLTSEAPPGFNEIYLADLTGGSYQLVSRNTETGKGVERGSAYNWEESTFLPAIVGASPDLSHVLYAPEDTEESIVDEWVDGKSFLVSVANNGESLHAFAGSGPPPNKPGSGEQGAPKPGDGSTGTGILFNDISSDGSRIYMTEGERISEPGIERQKEFLGELFLRENGDQPQSPLGPHGECTVSTDACTVQVSASQRREPDPNRIFYPETNRYASPYFWGASADGGKAFFTSTTELTDNADTGAADDTADLYEYDVESGKLVDLSVGSTGPDGAGVLGVVQISEDGSYVYFVAEGVLAEGAVAGGANLYVSHDGGAPRFIATLENGGKEANMPLNTPSLPGDESVWGGGPTVNEATVSRNGMRLAFASERSLTGYDNEQAEPGECPAKQFGDPQTGRCREIYLYDVTTNGLKCVSCNPSGARPIGPSGFYQDADRSGDLPVAAPRNMSEDGSRVFFQSEDALVPRDSNGEMDVYEYEDGHIYPISDLTGNTKSEFMDASGNGDDVFIATADQLVPQDTDFHTDVYDVRVGGGFPVSVAPPACNNGDSCKGPISPQPGVFGAPASATFSGAGNDTLLVTARPVVKTKIKMKPKRCKINFVKKRGKCVRRELKRSRAHSGEGRK